MTKISNRIVFREYLETLLLVFFVAIVLRLIIFRVDLVGDTHMEPNLMPGDYSLSLRWAYGLPGFERLPQKGDLVVVTPKRQGDLQQDEYVSRVFAVEGDRFEIKGSRIFLNEVPCEYSAAEAGNRDVLTERCPHGRIHRIKWSPNLKSYGPLVVPPGKLLLVSDDRIPDQTNLQSFSSVRLIESKEVSAKLYLIWLSLGDILVNKSTPSIRLWRLGLVN